jgi:hypothetical protein
MKVDRVADLVGEALEQPIDSIERRMFASFEN